MSADRAVLQSARVGLALGPDVIEELIPHRRPFLMIDRITGYARTPQPSLWTSRHISSNEEVFAGHFPGLHLWPGVYTIEGMGQSCNALGVLGHLERAALDRGTSEDAFIQLLRSRELAARLDPGASRDALDRYREITGAMDPSAQRGLAAAVDVKLLAPVFAGERVDFFVTLTKTFGHLARFDVEATVDGRAVARGALTGAHGPAR